MDLRDANSWPLRSPGILSRRAPCGFLPRGRQLLDQPSKPMRNPSHQLNARNGAKDMPDWGIDGPMVLSLTASLRRNRDDLAKCLGIAGENLRPAQPLAIGKMRRVLRIMGRACNLRRHRFFRARPLLRHGAQIVSARPMPASSPFRRRPSSPSRRWNSPPRCAASSR
jgi:hypothetical protein